MGLRSQRLLAGRSLLQQQRRICTPDRRRSLALEAQPSKNEHRRIEGEETARKGRKTADPPSNIAFKAIISNGAPLPTFPLPPTSSVLKADNDKPTSQERKPDHRVLDQILSRLHRVTDNGPQSDLCVTLKGAADHAPELADAELLALLKEAGDTQLVNDLQGVVRQQLQDTPRGILKPSLLLPRRPFRNVSREDVRTVERSFQQILPILRQQPPPSRDRAIAIYLNHMLYLAARIPSRTVFDRTRALYAEFCIAPDSHTELATILILDKTDQVGKLPEVWRSICDRDRKCPGYANIIHLNAILWAFAKRAQWDVVGAVYNKLLLGGITDHIDATTAFPSRAFFSSKGKGLPVPNGLAASAVTFQCILRCLTYHGDLISALSVLQDMDKAGFQPVVSDFVAFFQGFARFGEGSVEDEAGTGSMMPPVDSHTPTLVPGSAPQAKPAPRRLTDIWSDGMRRKNGRADPAGGHEEWNKGTLELLFQSLLGVPPQHGRFTADSPWHLSPHARTVPAPRPGAVFYILMAFRRVHGEDPAVLLDVLAQLERKFGPGNEEGWSGWKVDGRLRRLRENWMQARAEDAAI